MAGNRRRRRARRKNKSENLQTNLKNKKNIIEEKNLKNNSPCKWIWDKLSGVIEGIRFIITALPIITPLLAALYKYFYTIDAENYYGIEANLFSLEGTVGNTLITLMGSMLLIISVPTLLFIIHKFDNGFNLVFTITLFSLIMVILYIGLKIIIIMNTLRHIIFFLLAPVFAFLAIIGCWFMYQDDVKGDKSWRYNTIRSTISRIWGFKKAEEKTEECNQTIKKWTLFCATIFILFFIFVIYVYSFIVISIVYSNRGNLPSQKKNYEIVQMNNDPELNATSEQICFASNFQVVILHRGSQVLLMNGKIDGNETINPQEDMSSSNLVIDTRSYEFQEASQYRFYKKKFNDVTTNPPPKK